MISFPNTTADYPIYVPSFRRRAFAFLMDAGVSSLFSLPFMAAMWISYLREGGYRLRWDLLMGSVILHFVFQVFCLKYLGATLGKFVFGLRVVNANSGGELGWIQCVLRTLADGFSLIFGLAPRALMFLRFDRTHLSDWIAETQVRQFQPRSSHTKRRVIFALLAIYFLGTHQFQETYEILQRSVFTKDHWIISKGADRLLGPRASF